MSLTSILRRAKRKTAVFVARKKTTVVAIGIFLAVIVICYGSLGDVESQAYRRLLFFLTALIAIATLWDMFDRRDSERSGQKKIAMLMRDIRTIAKTHNKETDLHITFADSNHELTIESVFVDQESLMADLAKKIQPRGRDFSNIISGLNPSPEEEREWKIRSRLWKYRLQGIHSFKLALTNLGDIAAENFEIFIYIPGKLNPTLILPKEPAAPDLMSRMQANVPDLSLSTDADIGMLNPDTAQIHHEVERINPRITQGLDTIYIEPGDVQGKFEIKWEISTPNAGQFEGKLKLNVVRRRTIGQHSQ